LQENKLISSSSVCFALDGIWQTISLPLFQPMIFLILLFPACCCGAGVREQLGEHLEASQSQSTTALKQFY